MPHPKSILITGASSGIGAALAGIYAASGVCLALGGRDRARGRIAIVSAIAGYRGLPGSPAYAASQNAGRALIVICPGPSLL